MKIRRLKSLERLAINNFKTSPSESKGFMKKLKVKIKNANKENKIVEEEYNKIFKNLPVEKTLEASNIQSPLKLAHNRLSASNNILLSPQNKGEYRRKKSWNHNSNSTNQIKDASFDSNSKLNDENKNIKQLKMFRSSSVKPSTISFSLNSPNTKIRLKEDDLKLIEEESKKSDTESNSISFTESSMNKFDLKVSKPEDGRYDIFKL